MTVDRAVRIGLAVGAGGVALGGIVVGVAVSVFVGSVALGTGVPLPLAVDMGVGE